MKVKHRKSLFSKLIALCLAVVMMMSLGMTVSAAVTEASTKDVTVSGLDEGTTVSIYKVINVNINANGQPENPMYTWTDGMAAWLETHPTYKDYIDAATNAVTDKFQQGTTAEEFRSFWHDVEAGIKDETISLTPAKADATVPAGSSSVTFADVAMGEYLLTAKGGVKIYQPTTVLLVPKYDETSSDWTLGGAVVGTDAQMKGEKPGIEKSVEDNVDDPADNTVAVGDTVTFLLSAAVPSYPEDATAKKLIISDKLGTGLAFKGIVSKSTVHVWSDAAATEPINQAWYDVQPDWTVPKTNETRTFAVIFNDAFFENYTGTNVYVTYDAEVTEDAFANDQDGVIENDTFLGYNNDPYNEDGYKEDTDKEKGYTYAISLEKVDSKGNAITNNKAVFQMKDPAGKLMYFNGTAGLYTYNSKNTASTQGVTADLETDANGVLKIQGLDEGVYTLTETQAPNGYVLPKGTITITITDDEPDGMIDDLSVNNGSGNVSSTGSAALHPDADNIAYSISGTTISFDVENTSADEAGFQLPTTGGMGTMIFTIAGILLMGGAVALIVVAARKKRG